MCAVEHDAADPGYEDELPAPHKGSAEELLDANAHDPLDPMRHSAAHIMAEAVLSLFPEAKLGIGPAIKDGFYYDFELPRPLNPEDLRAIEKRMKKSVRANHPFERREWDPDEGRAMLAAAGQSYKVEILDDLRTAAEAAGEPVPEVTTYTHGPFTDLCRGPHVESTGKLGPFKLLKSSGAYWRGDEKRPMLQRIYGTVWSTKDELDLYLWRLEEARRRDHRRLGVALDSVQLPRCQPRLRLLASQGSAPVAHARDGHARAAGAARLPGDQHAHPGSQEALGAVGPLGPLRRQHVQDGVGGADVLPEADELPRVHHHLQEPGALLP